MNKIILKIGGMSCSACSNSLEKYLNKQNGIYNANVNLVLSQALIEYDDTINLDDINNFIREAGYESLGIYDNNLEVKKVKNDKLKLVIFFVLSIVILYISMSHMIGLPVIPFLDMKKNPANYSVTLLILTIPYLFYANDIFKRGIKNLVHKAPNMDTLVTLGAMSSFLYSLFGLIMIIIGNENYVENLYFESVTTIIFFIKLGRYVDGRSKEKTKEAIKELVQITPNNALLKTKIGEKEITIDEVKKDDILIAKPGMKIAVDGIIIKGETHLDEAFITGESIPIKKSKNDKVIAGSINYDGYIEYKAEKIGRDSTISEIVRLVLEATNTKSPIARLADKVSGYFVPTIIVLALLTFIGHLILNFEFSESINAFVTVLVVACPCALGLATPLAIVVGEGLCAENGILVKSSEILENAHKIDIVIFDKTGTLTYGNLKISKVFNYSKYSNDELINIVASLETESSHPISKAFIDYISKDNIEKLNLDGFKNIPGIGIEGLVNKKKIYIGNSKILDKLNLKNDYFDHEKILTTSGNSIIYVIENNVIIGLIGVKDIIRDNAKKTIDKLTYLNKEIIMLTGDNEQIANIIANSVGIKKVIANVMPKDKTDVIKKLISEGKRIMMVGDGINDAPSLAISNIGVSFNSGTDIAANSSDVILMNDDLEKIIDLILISKGTLKNIKQNLFWAFFYNMCMIPIATGFLSPFGMTMNPMIASFAMTISSLTVILNSLRLKNIKTGKRNNND